MSGSRITGIKLKLLSKYRQRMNNHVMNILVIAQLFPPDMGGGSTRTYNAVKGLVDLGQNVTVVTAFPHYPVGNIPKKYKHKIISIETVGKVRVIRVWVPSLSSRGIVRRFVLFISFLFSSLFAIPIVGRTDVIWAANPNVFSVYSALIYSLFTRCPIVQNVDDLWPEELYNLKLLKSQVFKRIAETVSRLAYASSKAITPISPGYVDMIVNKYHADQRNVYVIPVGVDLETFTIRHSECMKKENHFRVLYIGALSLAYDFDYVLQAAKLLISEPRIRFVIQGIGDVGGSLQMKVKEMGLQNVVVKLKVVSRSTVAQIMHSADVLLLPLRNYEYTGISSKLYEYQSAGKPIICCSLGEPGRYISETKSGIVVKPGDYETLAKTILYLEKNRTIAKKLGKSGRNYVSTHLSIGWIGSSLMAVFERVVLGRGR
jgi:colanic acid biosynthesis glycosyl transferase WcaI